MPGASPLTEPNSPAKSVDSTILARYAPSPVVKQPMRADRDLDLLLIERLLAPPPLDDARSSLQYWHQRQRNLPLYRLAARREAKQMMASWQETVRAAEQARFEASWVGRLLTAIGVSSRWVQRMRSAREALLWLAWAFVSRKVKVVVGGVAAVGLILVVAAVAAVIVVFAQLA